jgi:S-methylmethionine-dependent homocysteine/selenocysteine methylase
MNPNAPILADYPVVVLDGISATELKHQGCGLNNLLW